MCVQTSAEDDQQWLAWGLYRMFGRQHTGQQLNPYQLHHRTVAFQVGHSYVTGKQSKVQSSVLHVVEYAAHGIHLSNHV
jgi:hypothetical protein